jgi:hypothetical protein
MVVIGGHRDPASAELLDGAAYDPVHHSWRPLPRLPVPAPAGPHPLGNGGLAIAVVVPNPSGVVAVWTGHQVLAWVSDPTFPCLCAAGMFTPLARGYAWTPGARQWTDLPTPPVGTRPVSGSTAFWTGAEVLFVGGSYCPPNADCVAALARVTVATFDPATGHYGTDPAGPASSEFGTDPAQTGLVGFAGSLAFTGRALVVLDGSSTVGGAMPDLPPGGAVAALPLGRHPDSWVTLPTCAIVPPPADGSSVAWTGTALVVWDGSRHPSTGALLSS